MFDSLLKPWLIEVNHAPSLETGSAFDLKIKSRLVYDTIKLLNLSSYFLGRKKIQKFPFLFKKSRLRCPIKISILVKDSDRKKTKIKSWGKRGKKVRNQYNKRYGRKRDNGWI